MTQNNIKNKKSSSSSSSNRSRGSGNDRTTKILSTKDLHLNDTFVIFCSMSHMRTNTKSISWFVPFFFVRDSTFSEHFILYALHLLFFSRHWIIFLILLVKWNHSKFCSWQIDKFLFDLTMFIKLSSSQRLLSECSQALFCDE